MELYTERGYEQVTVADIAERAGLTSRTFFRYFEDKREVLFAGTDVLAEKLRVALEAAPAADPPLAAVACALEPVASLIGGDRTHSRQRQAIITAHSELQERELAKMAAWSRTLTDGLRARGVPEPGASLAARTGVAVFQVAFERWLTGPARRSLVATLRESFDELRLINSG